MKQTSFFDAEFASKSLAVQADDNGDRVTDSDDEQGIRAARATKRS